jgi:hypothetical protein
MSMEARILRVAAAIAVRPAAIRPTALAVGFLTFQVLSAAGAGYRTANFTVDAPTGQLAKEIGDAAENYRRELAQEWLGKPLPNWSKACPIKARVAPNLGAGGATSFVFDRGEVFGWRMDIQGSRERILDSVVPHEVTHTIFASHFRQPIPRWADEGACTTVEHRSEVAKQENMLIEFLQTRRGIPFSNMFAMKEYPNDVLPLYAQGHSLARFLIGQRGKREFLAFLEDGLTDDNWIRAVHVRYGYRDLLTLQNSWQNWVVRGRPPLQLASDANTDAVLLAAHEGVAAPRVRQAAAAVILGQDPGAVTPTSSAPPGGSTAPGTLGTQAQSGPSSGSAWPAIARIPEPARSASIYDASAPVRQ